MNKVKIPDSISASNWSTVKSEIAKDKALSSNVSGESGKLTTAVGALDKAYTDFDFGLGDPKGLTAASAADALGKFDKAASSAIKALSDAASAAGKAASALAAVVEKAGKEKGASPVVLKAATSAKTLASGPKDATAFAGAISSAVDAARAELEAACKNLLKQGDKKAAPAPAKASPKALADGKNLSALMRKSIALLRTPKGPPLPIKFMVLFNKANPKDLRLYLGPKPEAGLAKLKTQFPPEVKVVRVKDPKGQVVWDKGALTFLSDILKAGLAKSVQLAIRQQTKVTVKVRIKRSDGAVDEADAKDVSDDELKVSAAEEADMKVDGGDYKKILAGLAKEIGDAKGPAGDAIRKQAKDIEQFGDNKKFADAVEGIEKLEEMLAEGDVADSDGKDLQADEKQDAIDDLKDELNAVPGKVEKNKALKKETAATIAQLQKLGLNELAKQEPGVAGAKKALDKIEQLLGAAAHSSFPAAKVEAARKNWIDTRTAAIKGITELSKKINEAFKAEASQKDAVVGALTELGKLQIRLQTGLDNELNLAIKTTDADKQANLLERARDSLSSLQDMLKNDAVLQNIDNHDVPGMPSLKVVGNMIKSLENLEKALPQPH